MEVTETKENGRVQWREDVVTEVYDIPRIDDDMKTALFYNKLDFKAFQEAEQRRYDKMMMKQIQNMVREAMSDQIQEAEERGATAEEIQAMMPQTTEEIFAMLGNMPPLDMPAPPRNVGSEGYGISPTVLETSEAEGVGESETEDVGEVYDWQDNDADDSERHDSSSDKSDDESGSDSSNDDGDEAPDQNEAPPPKKDFTDNDIYAVFGFEDDDENETDDPVVETSNSVRAVPSEEEEQDSNESTVEANLSRSSPSDSSDAAPLPEGEENERKGPAQQEDSKVAEIGEEKTGDEELKGDPHAVNSDENDTPNGNGSIDDEASPIESVAETANSNKAKQNSTEKSERTQAGKSDDGSYVSEESMNESVGSLYEELNERFGMSISSDIGIEDLIPEYSETSKVGEHTVADSEGSDEDGYDLPVAPSTQLSPKQNLEAILRHTPSPLKKRDSLAIAKQRNQEKLVVPFIDAEELEQNPEFPNVPLDTTKASNMERQMSDFIRDYENDDNSVSSVELQSLEPKNSPEKRPAQAYTSPESGAIQAGSSVKTKLQPEVSTEAEGGEDIGDTVDSEVNTEDLLSMMPERKNSSDSESKFLTDMNIPQEEVHAEDLLSILPGRKNSGDSESQLPTDIGMSQEETRRKSEKTQTDTADNGSEGSGEPIEKLTSIVPVRRSQSSEDVEKESDEKQVNSETKGGEVEDPTPVLDSATPAPPPPATDRSSPSPRMRSKRDSPSIKRRKARSRSTDGQDRSSTSERKAGRKPSTSTSGRKVKDSGSLSTSSDHAITYVNGKKETPVISEAKHTTRRTPKKKTGQRKDYEVRGGWGSPFDFGSQTIGRSHSGSSSGSKSSKASSGSKSSKTRTPPRQTQSSRS